MKVPAEHVRITQASEPRDLELAAAIRAIRTERASSREVAALAERLAPQLAVPAVAAPALAPFPLSKWLVSVVLAFGVGLSATWYFARPTQQAVAAPTPRAVPTPVRFVEPAPLLAAAAPASATSAPPALPRPTRTRPQLKAALAPQPKAAAPAQDAEAELQLLGRSQHALEFDARSALALAEEHAATYPRGLFVQEREMLAIQALLKLQRRRAALARAKDFLSHYPTSPHARHLRPLLEHGE